MPSSESVCNKTDPETQTPTSEVTLVGRYRVWLNEVLGQGGHGKVYRGQCLRTGQNLGVKVGHRRHLRWEAKVLDQLQGRVSCPTFFAYLDRPDNCYLVMNMLGPSLEQLRLRALNRAGNGPVIPWPRLQVWGRQIIWLLRRLHRMGLVHRDLKPHNILTSNDFSIKQHNIMQPGAVPRSHPMSCPLSTQLYLIDFGNTRPYKGWTAQTPGSKTGTLKFMPIRAHLGLAQSPADDLWSLGYIMVYLYLGCLPWDQYCRSVSKDRMTEAHTHLAKLKQDYLKSLCQGIPKGLQDYFRFLQEQQPFQPLDYDKILTFLDLDD